MKRKPFYIMAMAVLLAGGCRGPSVEQRENRRSLDAILTAITVKNPRLLEESFARAKRRFDEGQFSQSDFQDIEKFVGKARSGNWQEAESDAYQFRRAHPYVKSGQ